MSNTFDWNAVIFSTMAAAYILAGVFVERWMDEKFFDPNRVRKDTSWREVLRVLLWIFYLPIVALLVRMGVKYRKAPKSDYVPPKHEPYTGYRAEPNVPKVVIPEGVTELDGRAFSFKEIGNNCFGLQRLVIPNTLTKIAPGTFSNLGELKQVEISPANPVYEVRGGHVVEKATGKLVATTAANTCIPEGVTEIGEEAFCCRDDVEEIVIPDMVTKIGVGAFQGCTNLTKVVIPESVTELCDRAFYECCNLAELHLPASLKRLGDAFDGSYYDGMHLYCHMPEPIPYGFESDEGYPPNINDWLCVAKGTKEKYEAAEPWNYYETIKEME